MENLRKLREERGLTQQGLGEKFLLTQQSIYKYENKLAEPDITTMKQMADFFHTSIDYLIGYTDDPGFDKSLHLETSSCDLSISEAHLIYLYRNMLPDTQQHLIALLEALATDYLSDISQQEKDR